MVANGRSNRQFKSRMCTYSYWKLKFEYSELVSKPLGFILHRTSRQCISGSYLSQCPLKHCVTPRSGIRLATVTLITDKMAVTRVVTYCAKLSRGSCICLSSARTYTTCLSVQGFGSGAFGSQMTFSLSNPLMLKETRNINWEIDLLNSCII